jgi:predicted ATPase
MVAHRALRGRSRERELRDGQSAVVVIRGDARDAPDRFLVALAALTLLAEVAAQRPLLCVIEDAHWLDRASAQVLGFVGRRLLAESVALVFAMRDPVEDREFVGLPELRLEGLSDEDARALLARIIPGRLDARVRDRIVADTRGNPPALLELPRGRRGRGTRRAP